MSTTARIDIADPAFREDPYSRYAQMRRDTPVVQIEPGGIWAVSRFEDVLSVLKRPDLFSSSGLQSMMQPPWLQDNPLARSLLVKDPPEHTVLRNLVRRAFTPAHIKRYDALIRERIDAALDGCSEGEIDFVEKIALPIPAAVIGAILGLDPAHALRYKSWSDALAEVALVGPEERERHESILSKIAEMDAFIAEVLAERRDRPGDDVLGTLITSEVDGRRLDNEELRCFLFLLLAAGLETTVGLLGSVALILSDNPALLDRFHEDSDRIEPFVEEVLRYAGPVHGSFRLTTADADVGGTAIPEGSLVVVLMASATRDDAYAADGDSFIADRPPSQSRNFPFGHGIHFCLGAAVARLEARVVVEVMAERLHRVERRPGPLRWSSSIPTRGLEQLPLTLVPRLET